MIVIIDYGLGNLRSVQKALERINKKAIISSLSEDILGADKLILPGVGHFKQGIARIQDNKLTELLKKAVLINKTPILGICLGMQLMTFFSEEGSTRGLEWINGEVKHFNKINNTNKIPHMGWNNLQIKQDSNPLLQGIGKNDFFYFVHSYFVKINNPLFILAESFYGNNFVSVFNKENIYGCQFHPEKSHDSGLKLLKNFSNL